MESGRFLLAIVLMIALVVVTNIMFPPTSRPPVTGADSVEAPIPAEPAGAPTEAPAGAPATPPPPADVPPIAAEVDSLAADTVRVESDLYSYGLSTMGAGVVSAELKQYPSFTRTGPVELSPEAARALVGYRLQLGTTILDLSRLRFAATRSAGAGADTVRLTHVPDSASAPHIEFVYAMDRGNYVVHVNARFTGAGQGTPQLLIDFAPTLRTNEANPRDDQNALAFAVNNPQTGIASVPLRDVEQERIAEGPLVWAALKNKYFLVAGIQAEPNPTPFGGLIARPAGVAGGAYLTATMLASAEGQLAFRLYMGPQDTRRLIAIGYDLRDVNTFGWRALQPILRPLGHAITWALVGMHETFRLSYGWVLVLFGILVRIVLWPLNAKAMRSQMKNMALQPRLKEIQTKYKTDPERLQKEMLKLYREEGFNPMGGCLPILIPFPILIALFFVFQSTIEFRAVPFLWMPDLSQKDPFYILPVMLGISMFLMQWLSMRSTADANPQMKFMMYFMPIFMTVLFLNFPSGLNLYYASMNLASIPQQLQINRERRRWQAARPAPAR